MLENMSDRPEAAVPKIRIERMNSDKSRKEIGSETVYHVYFELSESPPPEWRSIFGQAWKAAKVTQEATVEATFLVVRCQLQDVATPLLPLLKRVVTETNEAYKRYAQTEATALEHREDAWKHERARVEATASSLHFE